MSDSIGILTSGPINVKVENIISEEPAQRFDKTYSIFGPYLEEKTSPEEIITKELFFQQNFIRNENWSKTYLLSCQILKINADFIHCECIIDNDNKITQIREFPSLLFQHIKPLQEGEFIKIKISQKPGTVRTDIIDGKGLGIKEEFEIINSWDELEDFKVDKPF